MSTLEEEKRKAVEILGAMTAVPAASPAAAPPPTPEELAAIAQEQLEIQLEREELNDELNTGIENIDDGNSLLEEQAPPSVTAINMDDWSKRRGAEVLELNPTIAERLESQFTPLESELIMADFYAAAFEGEVEFAKNPIDKGRSEFMKTMIQTPQFQELHASTYLDPFASTIASATFSAQYMAVFVGTKTAAEAAGDALKDAKSEVDEAKDICDGLGGGGIGGQGGNIDGKTRTKMIQKLMKRTKKSRALQQIASMAGRYRRAAQSFQRQKTVHGNDDMVGIKMGGEIEHLIPSELSLLVECEDLAMLRIIERTAMIREYAGIEKVAKGPIVVVVDESGSMSSNNNIYKAKAIALALYSVARAQKRFVCLVGFSGGTDGVYLSIGPEENKQDELLDWCEHFYSGGTTCDVPLRELPAKWDELGCPRGKTDMIVITDALLDVDDKTKRSFLAWKDQETCKVHSVIVGDRPGDLADVSDYVHEVKSLDLDCGAMEGVMSV